MRLAKNYWTKSVRIGALGQETPLYLFVLVEIMFCIIQNHAVISLYNVYGLF